MKKFVFSLALLVFSIGSTNIRVVRGGGLAEMKAYSIVNQLPSLIKVCTTSSGYCGMNESQRNDLLRLAQAVTLERVELFAPASGPSSFRGLALNLNSQDLYTNGSPNKFGEILSLCLSILLRDGLHLDARSARWPYQVFSNFREDLRTLELYNLGYSLHAISLNFPNAKGVMVQALALEKAKVTLDLSADLYQQLACSTALWSIESWNYDASQNWVRAQILWTCQGHQWSGELQLLVSGNGVDRMSIVRKVQIR